MMLPLATQLKLLDSMDTLDAPAVTVGDGEDLVREVHQLARREGRTLSSEQVHQVLRHAGLVQKQTPVRGTDDSMWSRPAQTVDWQHAQQKADERVRAATRAARGDTWRQRAFYLALPLVISSLGFVWVDPSMVGALAFFCAAFPACLMVHLFSHDDRPAQRALHEAMFDREGLNPHGLVSETVERWLRVPGMASWLAQATTSEVPFLVQDAREAQARHKRWKAAANNHGAARVQDLLRDHLAAARGTRSSGPN